MLQSDRSAAVARRGFTLAEVLVSMGIFSLAIPAILGGMLASYGVVVKNAHQLAALNLARKKIENVMDRTYGSLSTTAGAYNESNVVLDPRSVVKANIYVTVAAVSGTARRTIAVTVRWTEQQRTFNVTLTTLVSRNSVT